MIPLAALAEALDVAVLADPDGLSCPAGVPRERWAVLVGGVPVLERTGKPTRALHLGPLRRGGGRRESVWLRLRVGDRSVTLSCGSRAHVAARVRATVKDPAPLRAWIDARFRS